MNKISFISADYGRNDDGRRVPGGSGWARCHKPGQALQAAGWDVSQGHAFGAQPDGKLLPLVVDVDPDTLDPVGNMTFQRTGAMPVAFDVPVVVVQRWMTREAPDLIRAARDAGQIVINDVDDWYWGLHASNRAAAATDPKLNPDANRDHYARALQASSLVTVSTPFLQKRLRERFGVRSVVLRNAVDRLTFFPQDVRDQPEILTVGWVGALGWRSGDLETVADPVRQFLAETGSTFVHHGVMPAVDETTAGDLLGLDPQQLGPNRTFVTPQQYPDLVSGFDIGIVPLSNTPFNMAKSWIKGLEYAAAGIPFIAQDTPEYRALADLGAGMTAKTPGEWLWGLRRLADPDERRALRESGLRVAAEQDWSVRVKDWESVYTDLL